MAQKWTMIHFITAKWDPPIATHVLKEGQDMPSTNGQVMFRRTRDDGRRHNNQWVRGKVLELIPYRYFTGNPTGTRDMGTRWYALVTIEEEGNLDHFGDSLIS